MSGHYASDWSSARRAAEVVELLRVGDRVDRLDLVVRDVQRDHGDRPTVAVLEHAARLAVDLDLAHPGHAGAPTREAPSSRLTTFFRPSRWSQKRCHRRGTVSEPGRAT